MAWGVFFWEESYSPHRTLTAKEMEGGWPLIGLEKKGEKEKGGRIKSRDDWTIVHGSSRRNQEEREKIPKRGIRDRTWMADEKRSLKGKKSSEKKSREGINPGT